MVTNMFFGGLLDGRSGRDYSANSIGLVDGGVGADYGDFTTTE